MEKLSHVTCSFFIHPIILITAILPTSSPLEQLLEIDREWNGSDNVTSENEPKLQRLTPVFISKWLAWGVSWNHVITSSSLAHVCDSGGNVRTIFELSELKKKKFFFCALLGKQKQNWNLLQAVWTIQTKKSIFKPAYNSLISAAVFFPPFLPTAEPGSGQPDTQCPYSLSSRLFGPWC